MDFSSLLIASSFFLLPDMKNCEGRSRDDRRSCLSCSWSSISKDDPQNAKCMKGGSDVPAVKCDEGMRTCLKLSGRDEKYGAVMLRSCSHFIEQDIGCRELGKLAARWGSEKLELEDTAVCVCQEDGCNDESGSDAFSIDTATQLSSSPSYLLSLVSFLTLVYTFSY